MKVKIALSTLQLLLLGSFFTVLSVNGIKIIPDDDLPCASGISTIPPLNKFKLPRDRFSSKIPSGVNVCDASCGGKSSCTYNWADSLKGFPFLLFKCKCPNLCPPLKMMYSGFLKINCKDVTYVKSRCKCPYGRSAFQCSLRILPFERKNPFYCLCCNAHIHTYTHVIHEIRNYPAKPNISTEESEQPEDKTVDLDRMNTLNTISQTKYIIGPGK